MPLCKLIAAFAELVGDTNPGHGEGLRLPLDRGVFRLMNSSRMAGDQFSQLWPWEKFRVRGLKFDLGGRVAHPRCRQNMDDVFHGKL